MIAFRNRPARCSAAARIAVLPAVAVLLSSAAVSTGEDWLQLKYDCGRSGNVPGRSLTTPLGLIGAVPLTDSVFTSPVVAGGRVYVVDGAGVAFCLDAASLEILWKTATRGGKRNCNNVASPAIAGCYLHFGSTAGSYYVLDAASGRVVREIACGEPIFSSPVVAKDRVYFVTLGARVYALKFDGTLCWTWDFVQQRLGFSGNRWSGADWCRHLGRRVAPAEQFLCSQDAAMCGETLVVPAGGAVVWLEDRGERAEVAGSQLPHTPTLGLSIGESGEVYRQWHRLDNEGQVDILRLRDGKVQREGYVHGTMTGSGSPNKPVPESGLVSFCSVSLRGRDVYRCRPEETFGFCRHVIARGSTESLGGYPSIASPILLREQAVYGGLDGRLYVVPLSGGGRVWSFPTAFGRAISAPVAVCDGRVYFGCEDGYLYALGPQGAASPPSKDLHLWQIRSPLGTGLDGSQDDWFTNHGNWANTTASDRTIRPPFGIRWIRRYEGTVKHFSTCGGGRLYTHTAEGQIFAVEQETGRLLWRRYWPGVYVSYTAPLYYQQRLLVPQAGLEKCRLRCLDAQTGDLLWEAPFTGSPSWNRQLPPIIYNHLVIYPFGTGKYAPKGAGETLTWLFGHGDSHFPASHKPLVRAWDLETGRMVWERDFSAYGSGGDDAGLCLMDSTLYYSCFFGRLPAAGRDAEGSRGLTAALDPDTGRLRWLTTRYSLQGGCTISGKDGRLYLGGFAGRKVTCLDARDGSLLWESEPVARVGNVVLADQRFLFAHADKHCGYLIDKDTGKILTTLTQGYKCTRFTLADPYLLGSNLDIYDLSDIGGIRLICSGPRLDPSECVGAMVSNGRIFYSSHGSGLQVSLHYGEEAAAGADPWSENAAP
jgi:outer membrane protein assembly factor BamB